MQSFTVAYMNVTLIVTAVVFIVSGTANLVTRSDRGGADTKSFTARAPLWLMLVGGLFCVASLGVAASLYSSSVDGSLNPLIIVLLSILLLAGLVLVMLPCPRMWQVSVEGEDVTLVSWFFHVRSFSVADMASWEEAGLCTRVHLRRCGKDAAAGATGGEAGEGSASSFLVPRIFRNADLFSRLLTERGVLPL